MRHILTSMTALLTELFCTVNLFSSWTTFGTERPILWQCIVPEDTDHLISPKPHQYPPRPPPAPQPVSHTTDAFYTSSQNHKQDRWIAQHRGRHRRFDGGTRKRPILHFEGGNDPHLQTSGSAWQRPQRMMQHEVCARLKALNKGVPRHGTGARCMGTASLTGIGPHTDTRPAYPPLRETDVRARLCTGEQRMVLHGKSKERKDFQ